MSHSQTYKVKGMHCASCASIIERTVKKIEGVESIAVNNGTENAKISFDESKINPEDFNKKLEPLGYSLVLTDTSKKPARNASHSEAGGEKLAEIKDMKVKLISAIPLAIISIFVMSYDILVQYNVVSEMSYTLKEFFHHLLPLFATYILFVVGKPYLLGFYRFLRYGKANMDTLIGIGTSAA